MPPSQAIGTISKVSTMTGAVVMLLYSNSALVTETVEIKGWWAGAHWRGRICIGHVLTYPQSPDATSTIYCRGTMFRLHVKWEVEQLIYSWTQGIPRLLELNYAQMYKRRYNISINNHVKATRYKK